MEAAKPTKKNTRMEVKNDEKKYRIVPRIRYTITIFFEGNSQVSEDNFDLLIIR